jgi:pimeloyl-ACP methyl ester carboxylesterase
LDWPDDVTQLADVLQLDRFSIVGYSGGGPYAAACAFKIPECLTATAIVSGMPPPEAPSVKEAIAWPMFVQSPEERRPMLMGISHGLDQVESGMKQSYPEGHPDRVILEQPGFAKKFIELTFGEALRVGLDGVDQDAALYALPWGFQLQDITAEVHLWQGEQDLNVPISAARYVADAIPNCHATFFKDEGHISITHKHIREILDVLVA